MSAQKKSKKTLLVVEDDIGLQSQLKWCFEGYEVIVAGDRESALNAIRRFSPAVVTLDLGLPPDPANVSEGLATLQQILGLAPDTKIIVVTGNDRLLEDDCQSYLGAHEGVRGPDGVLGKPVDRKSLLAVIRKVLDRQPA